uniref:Uncharacterized protein n=1 Tax=Romanomermis culicivorax TaxID=13658 RepID=A0A915JD43_ROMCU
MLDTVACRPTGALPFTLNHSRFLYPLTAIPRNPALSLEPVAQRRVIKTQFLTKKGSAMEGDLLESIADSSSTDVPPLDLIFNHHFMNKVFFRENFHPLTNDYMIGFWLATFLGSLWANPEQITDVLFWTLGDNNGFKTLTILPRKADNGHIWKGLDDPEAFKQVFRSLWEDTKSFFNDPKEFLRNKDADPALNLAIEIMENNKIIRNVIMTPTCGEDTCTEIGMDLIHKKELPKVDYKLVRPSMPTKYNNKYKQLCSVFKITAGWWEKFSQGVVTWTSFLALANSGNDYPCINSVGVGRITNEGTADALSVYLLRGNSMVQAIQNTNNIFKLSKDLVNHSIEAYAMDIELTQNLDIHEVTLDVFASSWENGSMDKHLIGTITFKSDPIDNMLYKKVKITAKHNFILTRDESTGHLRVVPLPITVCPFSPTVMLDRHSVYKNQVILFDDRSLPNYDLVKLDNTTLLITDVLSNAGKGLIFSQLSIPLLVVMVKNYKDDRMRTLTLKFEQEMQLSMDKVDENGMMEFDEFDKRFSSLTERLAREEFFLEYDTRIGINYEKIPEEISTMTNKLEHLDAKGIIFFPNLIKVQSCFPEISAIVKTNKIRKEKNLFYYLSNALKSKRNMTKNRRAMYMPEKRDGKTIPAGEATYFMKDKFNPKKSLKKCKNVGMEEEHVENRDVKDIPQGVETSSRSALLL